MQNIRFLCRQEVDKMTFGYCHPLQFYIFDLKNAVFLPPQYALQLCEAQCSVKNIS